MLRYLEIQDIDLNSLLIKINIVAANVCFHRFRIPRLKAFFTLDKCMLSRLIKNPTYTTCGINPL